jgi:hypothetical protein
MPREKYTPEQIIQKPREGESNPQPERLCVRLASMLASRTSQGCLPCRREKAKQRRCKRHVGRWFDFLAEKSDSRAG